MRIIEGQVIETIRYTPGIASGERFIVAELVHDRMGPMVVVRHPGSEHTKGPYWLWRFQPALERDR